MNKKALEAAKEKLQDAREKVAAMKVANDIITLARSWKEFLILQQQVFLRLKKAFEHGHSKAWSDNIINEQRSDDMLRYVLHARNADEHGINDIVKTHMGGLSVKPREGNTLHVNNLILDARGPSPVIVMDTETASNAVVGFIPARIEVLPVRDRSINYDPPTSHLGTPILSSVISIAELTVSYLGNKIHEGEAKFG